MEDLLKGLKCCDIKIAKEAYDRIVALEKSNRNWRRKCQRLRAKLRKAGFKNDLS